MPTWVQVPANGRSCPHTSLRRSAIYSLITPSAANGWRAPVESRVLRASHTRRGRRLVNLASLLAYIDAQHDGSQRQGKSSAIETTFSAKALD